MPNAYLKELADAGKHGSMEELEKKWDEAKKVANKEGKQSYAYVTAVFQRMLGIKSESSVLKIQAATRLKAADDEEAANKAQAISEKKLKELKAKFPEGKFPPKKDAVKIVNALGDWIDQFSNKKPTDADWHDEDARKQKDGNFLFICIGKGETGFEVALDYENEVVEVV